MGQRMDEWFEVYAKGRERLSSHQIFKGYIENHTKTNIGDIPIEKLTLPQLPVLRRFIPMQPTPDNEARFTGGEKHRKRSLNKR